GVAIGSYAGSAGLSNGLVASGAVGLGTNAAQTGYELTNIGGVYSTQNSGTYTVVYGANSSTGGTVATGAGAGIYALASGASNTADALYASNTSGTGYAGYFNGNVNITGSINVTGCTGCVAAGTTALSALTSS